MTLHKLNTILKGGKGSGNFGHKGRPGKRGGSGGPGKFHVSIISSRITHNAPDFEHDEDIHITKLKHNFESNEADVWTANKNVVMELSTKTGVDKLTVSLYVQNWNGEDTMHRYAIARSVQRVFGTKLSPYEKDNEHRWISPIPDPQLDADYDKITKAVYENTQEQLKKLGVSEVMLFRGMGGNDLNLRKEDAVTWHGSSLDSWTVDMDISLDFLGSEFIAAGIVMKSTIPASRIFSMSSSGPGTSDEYEMTVLGNDSDKVFIMAASP